MSVESPPAPASPTAQSVADAIAAEFINSDIAATTADVADQPVVITETCDDAEFEAAEEVLPPSLLSGEQLVLLYGKEFWKNPEYLAAYDAETQQVTTRLLSEKYEIESEIETLKTKAAASRAEMKAKERELKNHHEERVRQRGHQPPVRQLTIDSALPPDARPAANADPGAEPVNFSKAAEDEQRAFFDQLVKKFPISRWKEFGLTDADVKKLTEGELKSGGPHPITTVGDLQSFVNPYPDNPSFTRGYADIKGLGKVAVDRISDAELAFWAAWNSRLAADFAKELGLQSPHSAAPLAEEGGQADAGQDSADAGQGSGG